MFFVIVLVPRPRFTLADEDIEDDDENEMGYVTMIATAWAKPVLSVEAALTICYHDGR